MCWELSVLAVLRCMNSYETVNALESLPPSTEKTHNSSDYFLMDVTDAKKWGEQRVSQNPNLSQGIGNTSMQIMWTEETRAKKRLER